jgi:uncharacterized protein (DUF302 family)
MIDRTPLRAIGIASALAIGIAASPAFADHPHRHDPAAATSTAPAHGVLRVTSKYAFDETVRRIKADVAAKGIRFFIDIDQAQLGADANLTVRPSRLILFGNPPLGVQFLQSNPYSGLDWPVRMLILQEPDGSVSVAWNDFAFIADRYAILDRDAQFKMASEVAASIAASTTR